MGILQANLAAAEERAKQAENMLEAISRSALEAGASRSGHASPLPAGSPAAGSPAQPPATAESFGKKALFGLTMKWRGAAEKKVRGRRSLSSAMVLFADPAGLF